MVEGEGGFELFDGDGEVGGEGGFVDVAEGAVAEDEGRGEVGGGGGDSGEGDAGEGRREGGEGGWDAWMVW